MNREIKFRAFDTQKNKMYSAEELGSDEMQLHPNGLGFFSASSVSQRLSHYFNHLMPLQFTGKTDKDGVEIYEGDIFEFDRREWGGDDNIHVCEWNDVDAEWSWGGGSTSDMCFRKVIGNIYQHPELLNRSPLNTGS